MYGMTTFLGMTIGSMFLPYLSDNHGRRVYFILCLGGQETAKLCITIMTYSQVNAYAIMCVLFICGMFMSGRMAVGYCMMVDYAP